MTQRRTEDQAHACRATDETEAAAAPRARNALATRQAILCAARRGFARDGYDQVGCRDICADAGVDAALVNRYFGSKEDLFAAVLDAVSKDPVDILSGDRAAFGARTAAAMLGPGRDEEGGLEFVNLAMRSAGSPVARKIVRRRMQEQFLGPFADWVGGEDADIRASLAAAVLIGVAVMRGVLTADTLAADGADAAADRLARLLQTLVDEPAPADAS
ncbi:MAG: TetR family transcriptional regulator [Caulobacteraceae bacterium]